MNIKILAILFFSFIVAITPTYSQTECPAAPTPQLIIGQQGTVTPGPPNNVRDLPSRDGVLIGEIPGASVFVVLDGPVCDGEIYWWQVDYEGLIGWTAEGKNNAYWVVPIASTATPPPTSTNRPTLTPTQTLTPTPTPIPVNMTKITEIIPDSAPLHITYNPDGTMIAVTFIDHFEILDAQSLDILMNIPLEEGDYFSRGASWHPNKEQIAVTGVDNFGVYSVPDGEVLWQKDMPHYYTYLNSSNIEKKRARNMRTIEFTPDGEHLITIGDDGIMRMWEYGNDDPVVAVNPKNLDLQDRDEYPSVTTDLALTSDGERLAFTFYDFDVIHYSLRLRGPLTQPTIYNYEGSTLSPLRVTFSPDDRYIYYYSWSPYLHIWDTINNSLTVQELPDGWIDDLVLHPNNEWMALTVRRSGDISWIIFKDIETFVTRSEYRFGKSLRPIAISPDGKQLIIAEWSDSITLWEIEG